MFKLKKCSSLTFTMDCFGPTIRPEEPENAVHTYDLIFHMKETRNVMELRSFLGICNKLHRFLPNFVRIANLLNKKIRENHPKVFEHLTGE